MMARRLSVVLLSYILLQAPLGFAQERVKLRISSATKTLGYGPLWVASKKGFFDREGLDVELVVIRASDVGIQALAGGSLEIAGSASDAPIAAIEKGLDLAILPKPLTDATFGKALLYDDELSVMIWSRHPAVSDDGITREAYETGSHAALFDEIDMLAPSGGRSPTSSARARS